MVKMQTAEKQSVPKWAERSVFDLSVLLALLFGFRLFRALLCVGAQINHHADQGNQRKILEPGDKPMACFALCDGENFEAAYAYCNLHGLWKK